MAIAIAVSLLVSFFLSVILIVYKTKNIKVLSGLQEKLILAQKERISFLEARLSERKE